jgi:hypothetical protein
MAQAGRMLVCGNAGEGLGDSLYEAVIYVRGEIRSLGADARVEPMTPADVAVVASLLETAGVQAPPAEFKRVASARSCITGMRMPISSTDGKRGSIMATNPVTDVPDSPEQVHAKKARCTTVTCSTTSSTPPRPVSNEIRGLGAKRRLPHFDDLTFLAASLSRNPLEGYARSA